MATPGDDPTVADDGAVALELARGWAETGVAAVRSVAIGEDAAAVQVIAARASVSALEQHAAELRRMNRLYLTLSRVNHLITRVRTRAELLDGVCQAAVGSGRLRLAWVGWLDPGTARVVPVARCGAQSDYLDHISVYADDRPLGRGPTGRAVRGGSTEVCNDFATAIETAPWRQAGRAAGFGASAAFAIRVAGRVTGALTVYAGEAGFFQDKEVRLFEEIASDVAFALENLEHDEQRRQSEARIREQAEEIRQYFDSALDLLCIADRDGHFRRLNPEWERTLGFALDELSGRHYLDLVHHEDRPATRAALGELAAGRAVQSFRNRYRHRDGSYRWLAWRALVHQGLVHIAGRDITEQMRLQAEVEAQRLRAMQADRLQALGEMATSIAHEVNQPLNGIRTFAEGLLIALQRQWPLTVDEQMAPLSDIIEQVDRISEIIDHMRAFARDDREREPVAFSVGDAVAGALKLMAAQFRQHSVAVTQELQPDAPCVSGHLHAMEQVVINLLSNARDALHGRFQRRCAGVSEVGLDWRPHLAVRVIAQDEGRVVRLEVGDNGGGIPGEVVPRIFEPFFTTKEVGKGTGVGLAICRSIVDLHHGTIDIDNRIGDGVTFVVTLPAAPVAG